MIFVTLNFTSIMNKFARFLFLLLVLSLSASTTYAQQKKKKKKGTPTLPVIPKSKTKSIASLTKKCIKYYGYLTIYHDTSNGKAFIAINEAILNQPIIYFTYAENGLVNLGLNKGIYRETSVIQFGKTYNSIDVKKIKTGQYFNPDNSISKAKNANISDAFVASETILAKTNGVYLISASKLLGTEALHKLSRNIPASFRFPFKTGRINPTKTRVTKIRSYPENIDVLYSYTFDNGSSYRNDGTVADGRYVTVEVQHSFIQMPDSNFKARMDDPRVGYFTHQVNDMTSVGALNYRDVIHRWRLEKKDPTALISEPVKPITWWIENTTPKELIPTIKKAGETWNLAFEPLGFKNAVVIKVQPDSATWDAGDIRYNVLRWASSPNPPFGGYGPSFVNPITGEILGADIMLEWVFVTNRIVSEETFHPNGLNKTYDPTKFCSFGHHLHLENQFGLAASNAKVETDTKGKIILIPVVEQSLYYLILHEMGHTFGLNHNMKASQLHSPDDLNNVALTSRVGLTGSVMDYPAINFAPPQRTQGLYYTTRPGPYDLWAIDFGYSTSLNDPVAEQLRINNILAKSTRTELTFGNDADDMRAPGKGIDPRVNVGDLSSDAVTFAKERMEMCQGLINNALNNYLDTGESYNDLRKKVLMLTGQYSIQAGVVSRYVGGVYVERSFVGQDGAKTPYTPVPLKEQQAAMQLLSKRVFSSNPIQYSDSLLSYMQPQRRGFGFFSRTEEPKMNAVILQMQSSVLSHLLSASVLNRLIESESYGNDYNITLMMSDLTNAIFLADANSNVSNTRQSLQLSYVNRLISLAGLTSSNNPLSQLRNRGYSDIAKARAYASLMRIKKLMQTGKNTGDLSSKQHKAYILVMIERALK